MTPRLWSDDELDVLRSTAHLTAWDVAAQLGRTEPSVRKARQRLTRSEGLRWGRGEQKEPNSVGLRRLVAKTCLRCGELMDARWYQRNQKAGTWTAVCVACRRGRRSEQERKRTRERVRRDHAEHRSRRIFQAITLPAANAGQEYTSADFEVLANPDLTILEKSFALKRSYKATESALSRGGFRSRKGLGPKDRGVWIIDNPNAMAS